MGTLHPVFQLHLGPPNNAAWSSNNTKYEGDQDDELRSYWQKHLKFSVEAVTSLKGENFPSQE
jgi:hypothetical protein